MAIPQGLLAPRDEPPSSLNSTATISSSSSSAAATTRTLGNSSGPSTAVLKADPKIIAIVAGVTVFLILAIAIAGCFVQRSRGRLQRAKEVDEEDEEEEEEEDDDQEGQEAAKQKLETKAQPQQSTA